jgi:branched-chain amino acid transport system substrate-binding protein
MKPKVNVGYLLVLVLAVGAMPARSATAVSGPPIEIDAVIPTTGPAAFIGKSEQQGFQALENFINRTGGIQGRPIKIVIADTQSSPQIDVQLVNGLVSKHVTFFIDGGPSSLCSASTPLLEKTGPLDFCMSPSIEPAAGSFAFAAGPVPSTYTNISIRFLRERGLKRIAMISATDTTGMTLQRLSLAALQLAENKGVELIANEQFGPTDVSVAAQIAHIKALSPQALLVWTTGTPTATVLRALKDSGLDIPVVGQAANMNVDQLTSYASFIPKELYFAAPLALAPVDRARGAVDTAVQRFRDAFTSTNVRPDIGMLLPWDPLLLYVEALRHLGADASAAQLREYIARQRAWTGAMGQYDFVSYPQRGLGDRSLILARWDAPRNDFTRASRPGGYR